jgi:putative tryptophan/tyrosine transport system substrate-binding protein
MQFDQLRRREFISLLGGTAAAWPLAVRAQQRHVPTVGILNYASAQDLRVIQFLHALRDLGYVEGRNLALVQRHADGVLDRLPPLAAELVAAKVDLIIALGPAVWAAKQATTAIPIVIAFSGNPERQGVVASLARPGGNLTGFSYMSGDLAGKRLELLCGALAKCSRVAALYNPQEPATTLELEETGAAARTLGVTLQPVAARYADELEQAFASAERTQAEGLLVFTHGFAVLNRARIMELAARQRLPVMYGWREFVEEGGLMSYGPDIQILVRQAAIYVDRILRGEKPSNLPVQQPTRLELIINLKTAKALGLTVPPTLLARADEVIE